jgi:hypothetical protein
MRKANLARLLARRGNGMFAAPFEQGEIGPDLFKAACNRALSVEACGSALSGRTVEGLDQDQEPQACGDDAGDGSIRLMLGVVQLVHLSPRKCRGFLDGLLAREGVGVQPA